MRKFFIYFAFLAFVNIISLDAQTNSNETPTAVLTVSPEVSGGEGNAIGCYSTTLLECPSTFFWGGGQRIVCQFSGSYGAPYFCTETYCGNSNADVRRQCYLTE